MSAALLGTDGGSTADDGSSSGSRSSSTGGGSGSTRSRSRSSRRGDLHYARLDPNASLCDRLLHPARVQICYLRRLAHAFTWGYVASVVGVYGVGQGIGGNYFLFAFDFFAADDLRISPSAAAQLYGLAYIPATLKALFGILSDAFPICGYHRTVYIVGYALLGTLGWLWVGLLSVDGSTSLGLVGVPLFMCNLGLWGPDVIIDATNAERVKTHPQLASDIQSLTWGSLAVFGIYAGLTQGLIQDAFGARGLFLAGSITGLAMMVPAMLGWLREERLPKSQRPRSVCHTFREVMGSAERAPVFQASFVVSFFSLFLGVFGVFYDSGESTETVKSAVVLVCTPLIAATAYLFLRKTDPTIAKIAAFVYLRAVCPTTKVMFYWYHAADYNGCSVAETDADRAQPLQFVLGDIERDATVLTFIGDDQPMPHEAAGAEDHNVFSAAGDTAERPCLSATYLGNLIIVKSLFAYFGTAAYNAYFSAREYHWLFRTGQMLVVAFNLVDLLWVWRLNLAVGIPDELVILFSDAMKEIVDGLVSMPMYILTAKHMPPGVEATLYALQMGLWNFGEQTGRYLGVVLLSLLGGVEPPLFENIELLVLIRSLLSAAPLLIITAMIPVGSPREDAEYYAEAQTVEEQEEEENPNESADGCAQREERERIVRSP